MSTNLKNFVIKFFTKNILWKLFSLFLSISLWFLVMNINNPTEIKTFSVDLSLLNEELLEENNLTILNKQELENTKVQVKVKGTRQALTELNKKVNRDRIVASLNLEQFISANISDLSEQFISNIEISLPILSYSYEISSLEPVTALINLDKITTISKKINTKKVGNLKENYASSDVTLSSEYVQITGANSVLNQIETVFIEVDISNQSSNIEKNLKPIAYDSKGDKIQNVTFSPSEITVNIPVYSGLSISILEPTLKGSLKEGYIISNISYSPKEVSIFVLEEELNQIQQTISPSIDISGLSESKEFIFNINDFFKYKNILYENPTKITVKIEVEQEQELELEFPTSQINFIYDENNYEISSIIDNLILKLKGSQSSLKNINLSEITTSVNLTNLPAGNHLVKVDFELPSEVYLKEDVFLNISILDKENIATQEISTEQSELNTIE